MVQARGDRAGAGGKLAEGPRGEYLYALARPPWWSDVYANLALAMEGLVRFDLAASTWKLYLRSAPKAADARQVQSRIGEWKHEAERARKQN